MDIYRPEVEEVDGVTRLRVEAVYRRGRAAGVVPDPEELILQRQTVGRTARRNDT